MTTSSGDPVADVWLGDRLVGELRQRRGKVRFAYTTSVAAEFPGRLVLSTALPVQPEPFPADLTLAWFSGLLPEGQARLAAADMVGVASTDVFGLLREIGWECAGAVAVVPPGQVPPIGQSAQTRPVTADQIAQRLRALPAHPFEALDEIRHSLGGFQDKLLLAWDEAEGWTLPLNGAASTHIIKPTPARYPELAQAEVWTMTAAAAATPTAEVALRRDGELLSIVVTRFDRWRYSANRVRRLHQEDMCQALGVHPRHKYQEDRVRPSLAAMAAVLRSHSVDPASKLDRLLAQVTVNLATGLPRKA